MILGGDMDGPMGIFIEAIHRVTARIEVEFVGHGARHKICDSGELVPILGSGLHVKFLGCIGAEFLHHDLDQEFIILGLIWGRSNVRLAGISGFVIGDENTPVITRSTAKGEGFSWEGLIEEINFMIPVAVWMWLS